MSASVRSFICRSQMSLVLEGFDVYLVWFDVFFLGVVFRVHTNMTVKRLVQVLVIA